MKRTIKLCMALILLFSLFGCSTSKPKVELQEGKWVDNTYTNVFSELTVKLPENWVKADKSELAIYLDVSGVFDFIFTEGVIKDKGKTFMDMSSYRNDGEMNVSTTYIDLLATIGKAVTEKDFYNNYFKKYISDNPKFKEIDSLKEVKLGNYNYSYFGAHFDFEDVALRQYYVVRKIDDIMVVITITIFNDEPVDNMLAFIS